MTEKPPFPFELIQGGKADGPKTPVREDEGFLHDLQKVLGARKEPKQIGFQLYLDDLIDISKEMVEKFNGRKLSNIEARAIAQANIDMRNGDQKAFDKVKNIFPDLEDYFMEVEKEIRGEDVDYVQVYFFEESGRADNPLVKVGSNIVTHNLMIGQGVSINGKIYRINGTSGSGKDNKDREYGMLSLVTPEFYDVCTGGKKEKSSIFEVLNLDEYLLPEVDVKNAIEKTVPDSESLFGVKEEPRQTVKEILKNDLGAEWKERVKDYNDVELTDDDAQLIAQAEIDMMNGQVKAFDRVKKQFPDLAHLFVEKEKEIRGEDEVHVQVVFYENFGKVDAVSTKIASNIVTHNLRIGDGVTIRGKLYRVVGEGYNFDHDGHKYGMLSLVSPELYDKKKERSPNKQNVFKIVDLDNYILPATEQGK